MSADAPLPVAVVVPVRDMCRLVEEALASVRAQEPEPAEVLVVDDGSTGTGVEVAEVAEAAGAVLLRQPPSGAGAARNAGVRAASAPLVAFLDADDRMTPGRLAAQAAFLASPAPGGPVASTAGPAYAGVFGWARRFRALAGGAEVFGPPEEAWLPSTLMVSRDAFLASGGFDETLPAGELVEWVDRCRQEGRSFAMLEQVVGERRVHAGNTTRDLDRLQQGYLEVARRSLARHRAAGPTVGP